MADRFGLTEITLQDRADITVVDANFKKISNSSEFITYTTTGAANAYIVTAPEITSLTDGMRFYVRFHEANTSTVVNLNVNGMGGKKIYAYGTTPPLIGQIAAGSVWQLEYRDGAFGMVGVSADVTSVVPINIRTETANEKILRGNLCSLDSTFSNKLPDPSALPSSNGHGISFAVFQGVLYMAVAHDNAPLVAVYQRIGNTWIKLPNVSPPTGTQGLSVSLVVYDNQLYLAVGAYNTTAVATTSLIATYQWTGSAWTKLPAITGIANSQQVSGVALTVFENQLHLAVGHSEASGINTYRWTGSAWSQTSIPALGGSGAGVSFANLKGILYLGVARSGSPYSATYQWTGSAWTKLPDVSMGASYLGIGVALTVFKDQLYMALTSGGAGSNNVSTALWTGSAWTRLPDPLFVPSSSSYTSPGVALTVFENQLYMAVTSGDDNRFRGVHVYAWSGGTWVRRPARTSVEIGTSRTGVALIEHNNQLFMGVAHETSPYVSAFTEESSFSLIPIIAEGQRIGRALTSANAGESVTVEMWTR